MAACRDRLAAFRQRLEQEITQVVADMKRLGEKGEMAALNRDKARHYLDQLEELTRERKTEYASMASASLRQRQIGAEIDELEDLKWQHQGKLRLYLRATQRIERILNMNADFLNLLQYIRQDILSLERDNPDGRELARIFAIYANPESLLTKAGWGLSQGARPSSR